MMREYELTDQEYRYVVEALGHAEENALFSESAAGFRNAAHELMKQHEEMVSDD